MSNEIDTNQSKENLDVQNLLKKLRLYIKGIKSKRMISAKETFNKMKEFVQKVHLKKFYDQFYTNHLFLLHKKKVLQTLRL